jgi:hypothetical protein
MVANKIVYAKKFTPFAGHFNGNEIMASAMLCASPNGGFPGQY